MSPGQEGEDAGSRTLDDVKYVTGDWIDVAVFNNAQGGPPRGFDGPRSSFSRQGGSSGISERVRGRGDSYRGAAGMGQSGGITGGRNGPDGPSGDGGERAPPGGPRRDRERDRERDRDRDRDRNRERDKGGRW